MITYTRLNLYLLVAAWILRWRTLYPVLFTNSVAIFTSFHTGFLLDPSVFARVLAWGRCTPTQFHVFNITNHMLPIPVLYGLCPPDIPWWAGMASVSMHLLWAWAVVGSYDLSKMYPSMRPRDYACMWSVAIASHLLLPICL